MLSLSILRGASMKQTAFWRALVDGVASIGEGMASIFNLGPSFSKPPSYEEQFGTDAELLAADRKKIEEDFQALLRRIEKEIRDTSK